VVASRSVDAIRPCQLSENGNSHARANSKLPERARIRDALLLTVTAHMRVRHVDYTTSKSTMGASRRLIRCLFYAAPMRLMCKLKLTADSSRRVSRGPREEGVPSQFIHSQSMIVRGKRELCEIRAKASYPTFRTSRTIPEHKAIAQL
jgi:hypothetical protein